MGPLNPGVHVGSWEIRTIGGFRLLGKRHSAIALVDRFGHHLCYDLVGWIEHRRSRVFRDVRPFYSSWSGYRWTQVAPVTAIARVEEGIRAAQRHYEHTLYEIADSNRFVGMALMHARINLDLLTLYRIGDAPALHDYPTP